MTREQLLINMEREETVSYRFLAATARGNTAAAGIWGAATVLL
jgi:hypothetical protein